MHFLLQLAFIAILDRPHVLLMLVGRQGTSLEFRVAFLQELTFASYYEGSHLTEGMDWANILWKARKLIDNTRQNTVVMTY